MTVGQIYLAEAAGTRRVIYDALASQESIKSVERTLGRGRNGVALHCVAFPLADNESLNKSCRWKRVVVKLVSSASTARPFYYHDSPPRSIHTSTLVVLVVGRQRNNSGRIARQLATGFPCL